MPHSSGGGSHSGGSHSSSSRSGGGGSKPSRSTNYFKNSHHYAYYKDGKVHHFYNDKPITADDVAKRKKRYKIARTIWFCIYAFVFIVLLTSSIFSKAHKATTGYSDKTIYISDCLGVIDDDNEVYAVLEEFQEKSGVTPYVLTIYNDQWNEYYTSLENFAYDFYVNNFNDEMHWLIVYSADVPYQSDGDFVDWYWEGMQGDDTDPVLTKHNTDKFTHSFHRYLLQNNTGVSDALINSFNELNDTMYETHFSLIDLIIGTVGIAFHSAFMYFIFVYALFGVNLKTDSIAFELPDAEKRYLEDTCQYCGGMFIHGIHISCPHCGGTLPPAEGLVYIEDPSQLQN